MDPELTLAFGLHRAGRFADAARCYHALLAREPDHAEALHLFGVMHHQCGYFARAVELIGRAVALRPGRGRLPRQPGRGPPRPRAASNRPSTAAGPPCACSPTTPRPPTTSAWPCTTWAGIDEAVEQFRAALAVRPDFALAQNNLGTCCANWAGPTRPSRPSRRPWPSTRTWPMARATSARCSSMRARPRRAVALPGSRPPRGPTWRPLTTTSATPAAPWNAGPRPAPPIAEAVRLAPELGARVHANLGLAFQRTASSPRPSPASAGPSNWPPTTPSSGSTLANAHADAEDYAAAIPCCERLVALRPERAARPQRPGLGLAAGGPTRGGGRLYRRALELRPDLRDALLNRGGLHEELGEMAEAEACYRQALRDRPRCARAAGLPGDPAPRPAAGRGPRSHPRPAGRPRARRRAARRLLFGLAHVPDARGDYAEAAACLEEANALAQRQRTQQGRRLRPGRAHPIRRSADRGASRPSCSPAWPGPATRRASRSSSSACRGPGPRWSSRCWPAIPGSTGRANSGWSADVRRHPRRRRP